jgi:hypothetical protein
MLDVIHYKKFHSTELEGKLPSSEKISRNSCHESNTSNPNFPSHIINTDFCIIFKSWPQQENYPFSKTSTPAPMPTQPPTQ